MEQTPLSKIRELIGPAGASLSDAEVERIRDCAAWWADAMFEWWLASKTHPKGDSPDLGAAR